MNQSGERKRAATSWSGRPSQGGRGIKELSPDSAAERDERLRSLLRAADPAGAAPELAPAEVARLRREALAAVPPVRPRRLAAPVWGLVLAAAALAALAIGLLLFMRPERPVPAARMAGQPPLPAASATAPIGTRSRVAPVDAPRPAAASAVPASEPRRKSAAETTAVEPKPRRRAVVAAPATPLPAPPEALVTATADPRPVQVQLTTPGGTRIVWVLEPSTGRR